MPAYIFDTNIFNRVLDGEIDPRTTTAAAKLYGTHIELAELKRTRNAERRDLLMAVFNAIGPEQIPTASAVFGTSEWGAASWSSEDNLYQPIVLALDATNGGKSNNAHDALIAETAIRNGLVLVTEDRDLAAVTAAHGGAVMNLEMFLQRSAEG